MKRTAFHALPALAALLLAAGCGDMHDQPSFKAQDAPRLAAPAAAVPIQGRVPVRRGVHLDNPVPADAASLARGAELYRINCALCHGTSEVHPGKVGERLQPPPPNLHDPRIRQLSDSDIFQRITFGFGRMPPFELRIGYIDRWHIVNYVKTFE